MTQPTLPGTTDRRIDALLALLSDNAMIVISGAKIAARNRRDALDRLALDRKTSRAWASA